MAELHFYWIVRLQRWIESDWGGQFMEDWFQVCGAMVSIHVGGNILSCPLHFWNNGGGFCLQGLLIIKNALEFFNKYWHSIFYHALKILYFYLFCIRYLVPPCFYNAWQHYCLCLCLENVQNYSIEISKAYLHTPSRAITCLHHYLLDKGYRHTVQAPINEFHSILVAYSKFPWPPPHLKLAGRYVCRNKTFFYGHHCLDWWKIVWWMVSKPDNAWMQRSAPHMQPE